MWRLIKKWWFLQRLESVIALHTGKNSFKDVLSGGTVLLNEQFFTLGTKDWPGIIFKPLGKYSRLLFWRRHWKFENLDKLMESQKFKRKLHEYNHFFKYLKEKNYIAWEPTQQGTPFPNTTYLADDVHGLSGLVQLIADTFKVPWAIIGAIVTFIIGLRWNEILYYLSKIFN